MNYFFGLETEKIKSRLAIPRFKNNGPNKSEYSLYSCKIIKDLWNIKKINDKNDDLNFFMVNESFSKNDNIFFIAKKNEINLNDSCNFKELRNLNNFTDNSRFNLQISNKFGGFSSFQSEYPFFMINKKGNILAPISSLTNKDADINYIFIKNIYKDPIKEEFKLFFFDIKDEKVINEEKIYTNTTNCIIVEKKFIKPEIFLFTNKYLGVPLFVSEKNNHLSIEHTHPLHEYILSYDRFEKVKNLKMKINEIINQ